MECWRTQAQLLEHRFAPDCVRRSGQNYDSVYALAASLRMLDHFASLRNVLKDFKALIFVARPRSLRSKTVCDETRSVYCRKGNALLMFGSSKPRRLIDIVEDGHRLVRCKRRDRVALHTGRPPRAATPGDLPNPGNRGCCNDGSSI